MLLPFCSQACCLHGNMSGRKPGLTDFPVVLFELLWHLCRIDNRRNVHQCNVPEASWNEHTISFYPVPSIVTIANNITYTLCHKPIYIISIKEILRRRVQWNLVWFSPKCAIYHGKCVFVYSFKILIQSIFHLKRLVQNTGKAVWPLSTSFQQAFCDLKIHQMD